MENDRPPDLSEEALREIASTITKDWLRSTNRRSYEAWEVAQALEKELIRMGEWWREHWRWKEGVDDRLHELEGDMELTKRTQAVSAEQMATQIADRLRRSRLWDTVGTAVTSGVIVGVILLGIRILTGKGP